jgi:hypothetical protein
VVKVLLAVAVVAVVVELIFPVHTIPVFWWKVEEYYLLSRNQRRTESPTNQNQYTAPPLDWGNVKMSTKRIAASFAAENRWRVPS